jgi:hypothetical protein
MGEHYTKEGEGRVGSISTEAEARKAHHLASADPELDGLLTGPQHEAKYGLERESQSAAVIRAAGVHPYENRALRPDEDGGENVRGRDVQEFETGLRSGPRARRPRRPAPRSDLTAGGRVILDPQLSASIRLF